MAKKLLGFQKRFDELCYNKFACTKIANAKSGSGEDLFFIVSSIIQLITIIHYNYIVSIAIQCYNKQGFGILC